GAGKEHAEAMAGAFERGQPRDAIDSGRGALKALQEAKRLGETSGGFFPEERAGREAGRASETVERELAWAEQTMEKLRRAAQEHAKQDLGKSSKNEEGLADRARDLARKGETGDRAMPQEALDHLSEAEREMREAQRALAEGDGEQGATHQ